MKYRNILVIAGLLAGSVSYGQALPKTHADSVNILKTNLEKTNTVSGSAIGIAGTPSSAWYSFIYLLSIASNEELLAMTHSTSPAARLYAYTGLVHRKYDKIGEVKARLSTDKTTVSTISGCIMSNMNVAEALNNTEEWYYEPSVTSMLKGLKENKSYNKKLFTALVNGEQVERLVDQGGN